MAEEMTQEQLLERKERNVHREGTHQVLGVVTKKTTAEKMGGRHHHELPSGNTWR